MWWNRIIFGIDGYEVVMWFLTYSMMGWLVESIYMSFCNHKITNRGFAKGPFCPIYGFGALTVFFILRPYSDNSTAVFPGIVSCNDVGISDGTCDEAHFR